MMQSIPVSKIQSQFWLLQDINSNNGAYNLYSVFSVSSNFDEELFEQALNIVANRHEALKTEFHFTDGKLQQHIASHISVAIEAVEVAEPFREGIVPDIVFEEVNKPFDLSNPPLYRFKIFTFENGEKILSLTFHHIIIDVRAEGVFSKEVSEAYNALLENKEPVFDGEPTQYSEYTKEIEAWYNSEEYKEKLKQFAAEYPDFSRKIELPANKLGKNNINEGSGIFFELDEDLAQKLSVFSKNNGTNVYRVLLSAYAIFLQRLCNQESVTIGLPLTNRTRQTNKFTFGCFINALPLNVDFSEGATVADVITLVTERLAKNLNRQEIPFTDLVKSVGRGAMAGRLPYFQTGFAWKPPMQLHLKDVNAKPLKIAKNGAQLDLFYTFWEEDNHLVGFAEFNSGLFSHERISQWIENFKILLADMLENPQKNIFELQTLTNDDRKSWSALNTTENEYENSICLHQKFEQQVEKTPNAIALLYGSNTISYDHLNKEANKLAHLFLEKGIAVGDVIAYSLERCPELLVTILAIHKVGAAYLPFDTHAPVDRLESIIEDALPKLVVTKKESDSHLPVQGLERIYVDTLFSEPVHTSTANPDITIDSHNLAYILYTSGSTGKPKGVMIEHHSVMNKIGWMQYKYPTNASDTLVLKTPVTFDVSVWELFWWFFEGAKLLLLPQGGEKEPETIIHEVEEKAATVIIFVPSMFTSFIAYLDAMEQVNRLSSLNIIIQIGEALSPQLVRDFNKLRTEAFNPLMLNTYGPTEATVAVTYFDCPYEGECDTIYIGKPIFNTQLYVVNSKYNIQPVGVPGELLITGVNLSPGYLNRPELNADRFIEITDIFGNKQRAYRTGDLAFLDANGELDFMGRIDNQVKVRGYRIELGEIESGIMEFDKVSNCAVLVHDASGPNPQLVAYITVDNNTDTLQKELKEFLISKLPDYMIPAHYVVLGEMPLTTSGKINRKMLPKPDIFQKVQIETPQNELQELLVATYKKILELDNVGVNSNFFELGGTSLMAPLIVIDLKKEHGISIKTLNIFEYPTIEALSNYISKKSGDYSVASAASTQKVHVETDRDIAVIGMSGCFPGADNLDEFWNNIVQNKNCIQRFSKEALLAKGVAEELLNNADYVYANGIIDRGDMFDASFFGITPREADFMDPQHRLFLEVCYEALEDAGYAAGNVPLNVGVFAGTGMSNYLLKSLMQHPNALRDLGEFQTMISSDKDFLTTRVSYKLNLTGPSFDVQTACSTSLVAVHIACQNLVSGECDMALTGGVYIHTPRGHGYMYKSGGILSPKGVCKPFDADSDGTILGEGAGVVLLKRLKDAIRDKDNIVAVIKSTAINNDGANKAGYMAPSVEGQFGAIKKALDQAAIPAKSISYIETHGTGTKLGDPIEISALKKVHGGTHKYCALGAVKANIGHLDAAAGIAGLIKTILALKNKKIPALAHFTAYNPDLEIDSSPFYIPKEPIDWEEKDTPRRAGVSAFGIGGTNAHCIVEEYTQHREIEEDTPLYKLLPVSAKSPASLHTQTERLLQYISQKQAKLSDIAYTLQTGRNSFKNRQLFFAKGTNDISAIKSVKGSQTLNKPRIVFMFTGQGSQYAGMGKDLYNEFSVFKSVLDEANDILAHACNMQLLELLYNADNNSNINETQYAQPLIVAIQYALVKLLESFGIKPDVLIGHSIGELTAACVSGVFSFKEILFLAARRGSIMQEQPRGSMLSVNTTVDQLQAYLTDEVEVALINAPNYCVVSGTDSHITAFQKRLAEKLPDVQTRILETSHAFHSSLMESAVEPFQHLVEQTEKGTLHIPFISNFDGAFIEQAEAVSAEYWGKHIRNTVNFSDGIQNLLQRESLFVEVGPGSMLTSLVSQFHSDKPYKSVPTMRSPKIVENDVHFLLAAIAQYWVNGGEIHWSNLHNEEDRRISLPTYAFNRKKHWIHSNYFSFDYDGGNAVEQAYTGTADEQTQSDELERTNFTNEYVAPENDAQKTIVKIWEELLGVKNIGIIDDFFDLGGHSLLASQVITRLNKTESVKLPLETLFTQRTVKMLATLIEDKTTEGIEELTYEKIEGTTDLPVSSDQTRLWVISQFDNNPAYNIPFSYKIGGHIDVNTFKKSLLEVFNRHAQFRGNIKTVEISPRLFINSLTDIELNVVDFSEYEPELKEQKIQAFITNDIRTLFDIANDNLYRIYLLKTAENEMIFHMTIHHIIFDGWSWGVFVDELNTVYDQLISGDGVQLPALKNHYHEYAQWQQTQIPDNYFDKSIAYWKKQLESAPSQIHLPHDFKRKNRNSGLGARAHFSISKDLNETLKSLSKQEEVTEFTTYISAFSQLLSRYSGDKDICIGIPTANRPNSTLEKMIGFFVNTLVLRFEIKENENFITYLERSKTTILQALEHQHLPFEKLVDVVNPPRVMNVNPVFQVMFSWLNAPRPPMSFSGVSSERYVVNEGVSPLDMTVYVWEDNGTLEGEIEYSTDIFSQASMNRFKENYIALLEAIASQPQSNIHSLNCISDTEKEYMNDFNATQVPVEHKLVHEMFEKQCAISPYKTALICNNESWSYEELNTMSNKIAAYIKMKGVKEHDVVGISMNRSFYMLASVLAILKSGATYLPLDPSFPKDRLQYMLSDSNAKILITEKQLEENIDTAIKKIILDSELSHIEEQNGSYSTTKIESDSLAYLIYTSGSTGKPKGVKVQHGAVTNFIESMAQKPGLSKDDRLLAVTTLSFDISVLELFLPLYKGATIVLARKSEVGNGAALITLIENNLITVLQATPATWNILNHSGWKGDKNLKALCGGEAISVSLIKELLPKVKELWNMYGPTETTVWSTCCQILREEAPVLVGKPINNTTVYMLSPENNILPIGCAGEVSIGGLGVTMGYHNRPELTNEKFIQLANGERVYKTGDLGRYLYDGHIELFGRIDNQIKLRGFRIEPGEIEVEICKFDAITEAVVKVQKFSELDERLVAFVNVNDAFSMESETIIEKLKAHLPDYMIPSHVKIMKEFPRTPNGKIDKQQLVLDNDEEIAVHTVAVSAPNSEKELEQNILKIWQNVIQKKNFSIHDNFFDIGGNSMLLIQVANSINNMLGKEIDIMFYFAHTSVKLLSEHLMSEITFNETEEVNTSDNRVGRLRRAGERRKRN